MSQSLLSAPVSFQKVEVIPNKVDKDGHHYLKVLLLSNKKTKNNWIAPYKNIGELPKAVLDSFMNLPHISKHDHEFYDQLDETMKKEGLSTEERYLALRKKCDEVKDGYIDWLFLDNPSSTTLYGQWKVTDPEENKYIEEHGESSKIFTSPALSGTYDEQEDGTKVYHIDTIRAFHVAGVPIPAFDESEAMVKGICKNGNSESCRDYLQYAGVDSVIQAPNPSENVNNTCSCNSNIDNKMSDQSSPQLNNTPSTTQQPQVITTNNTGSLLKSSTDNNGNKYTIEAPVSDKPQNEGKEGKEEKTFERNSAQEVLKSQKQIDAEREKEKLEAQVQALLKQNNDQKNFFLDEMLSVHIPQSNFEKEEDYVAEKNIFKTFINKYEISLEDAKWLITKAVTKPQDVVQAPNADSPEEKKKTGDKRQYAGWEGNGYNQTSYPSMFQTDFLTKPPTKSGAFQQKKESQDEDYPIPL